MEKLVSVITPVYNAEKTIERCIKSIIEQTYRTFEFILVDDGSTDSSYFICDSLKNGDARIVLVHQENQGVSEARNTGLRKSKGEFIFFVDADDYIEPTFIENFMKYPHNYPYVAGGYVDSNNWILPTQELNIGLNDYIENCEKYYHMVPSVHVTGNRYSAKIIKDHRISFESGCKIGEDIKFNASYIGMCDVLCVSSNHEYHYTVSANSLVNSFHEERLKEEKEEAILREKLFKNNDYFQLIKYIHWHTALEHYYSYLKSDKYKKIAASRLKESMSDKYFRRSIKYMVKEGTVDMKIEGVCLFLHNYQLYKDILKIILRLKTERH